MWQAGILPAYVSLSSTADPPVGDGYDGLGVIRLAQMAVSREYTLKTFCFFTQTSNFFHFCARLSSLQEDASASLTRNGILGTFQFNLLNPPASEGVLLISYV